MNVVCGTDFSERSAPAQRAAGALASKLRADALWLVHVIDPALGLLDATTLTGLEAAATRRLEEEGARLAATTAVPVRTAVIRELAAEGAASVADALWQFAARHEAGLVVVASRGYGGVPLLRVGGTSERIALTARAPVIVVRDASPFVAWAEGTRPLRVLVGADATASSAAAIAWVRTLAAAGGCEVVVGHVYWPDEGARRYGLPAPEAPLDAHPEVERLLVRDLEAQVGAIPGGVGFRCRPAFGRLGDHLLELAEAERADVIVVGMHRHRALGRLASVSSVALHHAHASVACVPALPAAARAPQELPRVERVLVATDLSPFSAEAVAHAYALLAGRAGEVLVVHVAPAAREGADRSEDAELVARARALVPRLASLRDVVTRVEVVHGDDVAAAICEAGERFGADVLCLASHGRTGVRRAVLGSVAESVLRRSQRPVLVSRPPPA